MLLLGKNPGKFTQSSHGTLAFAGSASYLSALMNQSQDCDWVVSSMSSSDTGGSLGTLNTSCDRSPS